MTTTAEHRTATTTGSPFLVSMPLERPDEDAVVVPLRPVAAPGRVGFLGTWVDLFDVPSLVEHLAALRNAGGRRLVVNHNVNSLTLFQRDARMRGLYARADASYVDGMPVVWLARLLGQHLEAKHRVAVLDWIWPVLARAEREGWSVVHLGVGGEVGARAEALIRERHPRLRLRLVDGHFDLEDPQANARVVAQVRSARPDLFLVGMGMPRQEHWLEAHLDELPGGVVVTVGGILGYLGGDRPTPPRWVGRLGVEWLFRLLTEPRRLWRRYLVEPAGLVPAVLRELRGQRAGG